MGGNAHELPQAQERDLCMFLSVALFSFGLWQLQKKVVQMKLVRIKGGMREGGKKDDGCRDDKTKINGNHIFLKEIVNQ